ncbi:conserved hypothetical protein [Rhodopseudomonas palustris HaA2]|uniref:DUF2125 domain-containing protein n=1 Tax=Rhodopseudomonas palustris (strain HaA2) TaxID=316058 RepID=Q2J1W0_RHOP2|nr:DUF2125 domain-containing protein [Rhodopseudomonas palustris]ABD05550.1 conserved hypothetical protein [Rhodopseudomonas palustris HaA2]
MTDIPPTTRRRLWPLYLMPTLLLIAAIGWSLFWFVSASQVDRIVDNWRAREAAAGRVYECGDRTVAGFPFRLEVRCTDASVALTSQTAEQVASRTPLTAKLGEILVVAQIYDPRLLIAEFKGPASFADRGRPTSMVLNWATARSSVAGLPGPPQRVALVFDAPALDRVDGATQTPLARARHAEMHARQVEGPAPDQQRIETDFRFEGASIQELHPLLAELFDANLRVTLSGLKDFRPKPWPERFRELQAAGGRIEITQARIQQGGMIATAIGALGLTPAGNVDGELQMVVAGLDQVIPKLGIDKVLEQGVSQSTLDRLAPGVRANDVNNVLGALDRAIPGLGRVVRQNANVGVAAGINALGQEATLEGRPARAVPLRFVDGAVMLGPIKVAQMKPLF